MLNTGISLQRLATKAGVGFTPKKLFSNGEAGVWYDPSDVEASLTWRRNLLEYTETYNGTNGWSIVTHQVANNFIEAPDGTQTAAKLTHQTSLFPRLAQSYSNLKDNTVYTASIFLKAGTKSVVRMRTQSKSGATVALQFDLTNGTATGHESANPTIENVGNGWFRCTVSVDVFVGATTPEIRYAMYTETSETNGWTEDGDTIYAWGAQLEQSSTATEYQPIRTTFDNAFKQAFLKHTLYQNDNGKTPVTGLGQAVGLMLDKSQGKAFGDEEVTNGGFDSASNWAINSADAASNISNGVAYVESAGSNAYITQQLTGVTAGKMYRLEFNLISEASSDISDGLAYVRFAGVDIDTVGQYQVGRNAYIFTAGSGSKELRFMTYANDGASFTIDDVSVKEVKGSHATQSDSTKRPVFARHPERGRVNLFKYTEEFDNGAWTKSGTSTITVNAATAPNGTQTADRINNFDDVSGDRVYQTINITNSTLTGSVWVKGEGSNIGKNVQVQAKRVGGTFVGTNVTHTLTDSWVRIDATFTQLSDNTGATLVLISPATNSAESLLVWGAQLEEANEATGYQKVVDDFDITESGYKSVYYLQFDGVNDGMQINNLTSSSTPITALFGYSKQNMGTTYSYLLDIESGRNIIGTGNQANQLQIYDTTNSWQGYTTTGETQVATFELDTNDASIRKNGIEEFTTSSYVISPIGGRVGLFAQFNTGGTYSQGNLYQCVLRAATSTDKEIDQAEEFVAIKTGLKSEVVGLATLDLNFGANTYTARNSNGSVL